MPKGTHGAQKQLAKVSTRDVSEVQKKEKYLDTKSNYFKNRCIMPHFRNLTTSWKQQVAFAQRHSVVVPSYKQCRVCSGVGTKLKEPCFNRKDRIYEFGCVEQCTKCMDPLFLVGWGEEQAFSVVDDVKICKLLNLHGMPMTKEGIVSPMHFYRSAIQFHLVFRHKQWRSLVRHIQSNFSTTFSVQCGALSGYRGWYNTKTLTYANTLLETT